MYNFYYSHGIILMDSKTSSTKAIFNFSTDLILKEGLVFLTGLFAGVVLTSICTWGDTLEFWSMLGAMLAGLGTIFLLAFGWFKSSSWITEAKLNKHLELSLNRLNEIKTVSYDLSNDYDKLKFTLETSVTIIEKNSKMLSKNSPASVYRSALDSIEQENRAQKQSIRNYYQSIKKIRSDVDFIYLFIQKEKSTEELYKSIIHLCNSIMPNCDDHKPFSNTKQLNEFINIIKDDHIMLIGYLDYFPDLAIKKLLS